MRTEACLSLYLTVPVVFFLLSTYIPDTTWIVQKPSILLPPNSPAPDVENQLSPDTFVRNIRNLITSAQNTNDVQNARTPSVSSSNSVPSALRSIYSKSSFKTIGFFVLSLIVVGISPTAMFTVKTSNDQAIGVISSIVFAN